MECCITEHSQRLLHLRSCLFYLLSLLTSSVGLNDKDKDLSFKYYDKMLQSRS